MTVTTCLPEDVPKGTKLTFEASGKLSGTTVVASQRGTTVSVEKLFHNLPVRRRELERNIKREWQKVINLLNQYACIQTNTKFSVSQQPTKGKRIIMFSTKNNPTTRENIINIFGAKATTALVPLDLTLEMEPSSLGSALQQTVDVHSISKEVKIIGHVSRPAHGEGRQTPDRQMFFINGRPCALPQFAKTFNEVYKSYNSTQSPFIFADIQLDTHMYDVNVSPDKRTILLHDQGQLLDSIRSSLTELFDSHEYTVPTSELARAQQTPSRLQTLNRASSASTPVADDPGSSSQRTPRSSQAPLVTPSLRSGSRQADHLIDRWVQRKAAVEDVSEDEEMVVDDVPLKEDALAAQRSTKFGALDMREHSQETEIDLYEATPRAGEGNEADIASSPESNVQAGEEDKLESKYEQWVSNTTSRQIPAVTHLKETERGINGMTRQTPVKRPTESIQMHIGDPSTPSGSSKRRKLGDLTETVVEAAPAGAAEQETDDDVEDEENAEGGEDDEEDEEPEEEQTRPSFGTGLTQKFAAGGSAAPTPMLGRHSETRARSRRRDSRSESGLFVEEEASESEREEPRADDVEEPDELSNHESGGESEGRESGELAVTNQSLEDDTQQDEGSGKPEAADTQALARATNLQANAKRKDTTLDLVQTISIDELDVFNSIGTWTEHLTLRDTRASSQLGVEDITAADAESKLSLIIQKSDFGKMRVAGQFNLGFIIAVRPSESGGRETTSSASDELFIIDQHASDEKYNFERLQDTTVVQSQRLVHPKRLELTALEEEIVMQNTEAIEANGFKIDVNTDGDYPVGSRCQLTSLPLSRETVFDVRDLEELISLLGDEASESKHIPRPSKVRKMFAMRACRSSIMIGKALTRNQMYNVLGHMGELDKPWNCPHGRPTMRHLCRLQSWEERSWGGDGFGRSDTSWAAYARGQ